MELAQSDATEETALWDQLRSRGDSAARERLLALHLPYARVVAASYYARRFHDEIEFGDYLQYACVGLVEAVDRYDPARGVQFRTFAARRMHGAILNGLERFTEKQQQIAARQRMRAERMQDVKELAAQAAGSGGSSSPSGSSASCGSSAPSASSGSSGSSASGPHEQQQLLAFVAETGIGLALCWLLEGSGMVDDAARAVSQPFYRSVELRQLRERLVQAVEGLPAQERAVIRSHYLQELPFEQIAATLQVTRGRISQVHRQALSRLRGLLSEHADWNAVF